LTTGVTLLTPSGEFDGQCKKGWRRWMTLVCHAPMGSVGADCGFTLEIGRVSLDPFWGIAAEAGAVATVAGAMGMGRSVQPARASKAPRRAEARCDVTEPGPSDIGRLEI